MSPKLIHTTEEATRYLAEALGPDREYRMFPFELGWVIYPVLSDEEISQSRHIGLSKMVLDAATGVITEFPSLPVQTVAEIYTTARRDGSPMPGGQIFPPTTRAHVRLIRNNPTTVEYLIRPETTADPSPTGVERLLVIDKTTRIPQPPDTLSMMATSWIDLRQRTDGIWPNHGTIQY